MSDEDGIDYGFRAHAFARDRVFRLTEDALVWQDEDGPIDGVYYDDIAEIRLAYVPTRVARNRYRMQVIFRQGGMVELFNTHYAGFADFEERNAEYSAFVKALHHRLAERGAATVYRKGSSPAAYAGNVALTVFIFAMLALAFVLLLNFGVVWIAVAKLGIILFFVPTLIRFIRRARPATYDPRALPAGALPTG
jgi:hypothetical protein